MNQPDSAPDPPSADLWALLADVADAAVDAVGALLGDPAALRRRADRAVASDHELLLLSDLTVCHATRLATVLGWVLDTEGADRHNLLVVAQRSAATFAVILRDYGFCRAGEALMSVGRRLPGEFDPGPAAVQRAGIAQLVQAAQAVPGSECRV
jgi:hypothetical protein